MNKLSTFEIKNIWYRFVLVHREKSKNGAFNIRELQRWCKFICGHGEHSLLYNTFILSVYD